MKTRKLIAMFCCTMMFALMGLCFTSCGDDDEKYSEMTIEVDAVAGVYTNPSTKIKEPGMYIREVGTKKWYIWSQAYGISGFTYDEGYYYRLVIGEYVKTNSDLIGISPVTYKLIKVLEKTPTNTSLVKDGK